MKILFSILVLVLLLSAVSFLLPSDYRVERSVVIAAEPQQIFQPVATLKTWPEWTAWTRERDPGADWSFTGPATGPGSVMKWQGEELGDGELTLTMADPNKGIGYDLSFEEGKYVSTGGVTFAAEGDGTRVTWFNEGELGNNPVSRYMGLMIDKFMGSEFETCLEGLKGRVEAQGAAAQPVSEE